MYFPLVNFTVCCAWRPATLGAHLSSPKHFELYLLCLWYSACHAVSLCFVSVSSTKRGPHKGRNPVPFTLAPTCTQLLSSDPPSPPRELWLYWMNGGLDHRIPPLPSRLSLTAPGLPSAAILGGCPYQASAPVSHLPLFSTARQSREGKRQDLFLESASSHGQQSPPCQLSP